MGVILNLETATTNCSVSLARDGLVLAIKENNSPNYSHAEQLHLFIQECLKEAGLLVEDLDAIAVSKGPGSYTGLRIGVSAAKGLCYALDVPLISIATLDSMAYQVKDHNYNYIIPLLDARRMEVYAKIFDAKGTIIRDTKAEIIDETSFNDYLEKGKTLLFGSGAQKCQETLKSINAYFDLEAIPSSGEMASLSYKKLKASDFEDVAYFEPFYLKDFMLTTKKP